jgi:hypothetical protein
MFDNGFFYSETRHSIQPAVDHFTRSDVRQKQTIFGSKSKQTTLIPSPCSQ